MKTIIRGLYYRLPNTRIAWSDVEIRAGRYASNDRLSLSAYTTDPEVGYVECLTYLTVNLPEEPCPSGEAWFKTWGENSGIIPWLRENGIISDEATAVSRQDYVDAYRFALGERVIAALAAAEILP